MIVMDEGIKIEARNIIKKHIDDETAEIERNRKEINNLSYRNTILKRLRASHIKVLSDFINE